MPQIRSRRVRRRPAAVAVVPATARRRRTTRRVAKAAVGRQRDGASANSPRAFGLASSHTARRVGEVGLGHPGVDRKPPILPQRAGTPARKVSPVEASTRYLKHIAEACEQTHAKKEDDANKRRSAGTSPLTVPASFDAAARTDGRSRPRRRVREPRRFWKNHKPPCLPGSTHAGDDWRKQVAVGEMVLVADVGGGTTDFTLIEVGEEDGTLAADPARGRRPLAARRRQHGPDAAHHAVPDARREGNEARRRPNASSSLTPAATRRKNSSPDRSSKKPR